VEPRHFVGARAGFIYGCCLITFSSKVSELHHFYAAPAKYLDVGPAAPAAPAPTLNRKKNCTKLHFI
jgi:hypothetical protein